MRMRLLASVKTPAEAIAAVEGGADVIDCKEPAAGALGALPFVATAAVVKAVARRVPVSATVGDLPMDPGTLAQAVRDAASLGVDLVKIGLFDLALVEPCARAIGSVGARCVAVVFADRAPYPALGVSDVMGTLARAGFVGVMLDTADKAAGGLREHLSPARLRRFVADARAAGLFAGLAGSLSVADVAPLSEAAPDLLGFRTALCGAGGRVGDLDPQRVAAVRRAVDAAARAPDENRVGGRTVARAARREPADILGRIR